MTPDPAHIAGLIEDVVEAEIIPHYGRLGAGAVREKSSPTDLVTAVDEAAERALRKALMAVTPGAGFIGEEAAAEDPSIVAALSGAGRYWVVDPLDGTRNFVNGVDEFGCIIAYVEHGRTLMGWIYDIPHRACAMAVKGEGVIWKGEKLRASSQGAEPPHGLRSIGWLTPQWRDRLSAGLRHNVISRSGYCSAYAYLKLARGEIDFKLSSRIHPWDHAAGALILEETGGSTRWLDDGAVYTPADSQDRPLLATAAGRDWRAIADLLFG